MPIKRQTAKKIRIVDLVNGEFIKKEGMEPSFVQTKNGESLSRVRLLVTIMSKFVSEDKNFASVTIDDGSDTMRAKLFREIDLFNNVQPGDLVDMIGKVKKWNDEIYLIPEVIRKITNPNFELLRRLELLANGSGPKQQKTASYGVSFDKNLPEKKSESSKKKPDEKEELRKKVLDAIESEEEGISFTDLFSKLGLSEEKVEEIINDLLGEGICYEPSPGIIKKI